MLKIKIENLKEVEKTFKAYPKVSAKYFQKAISRSLIKIERRAKKNAPVDTGALRARWNLDIQLLRGSLSPKSSYAPYVEYGTKPHWVSVKKLSGWAGRHNVSPFAVQKAIARKGTRKQPFLIPAVKPREVNEEFKKAINKTLNEI